MLRSARLTSGISQSDLAARTQTSQPDISTIEAGKRTPTVDTLERLLRQTGHRIIAVPGVGPDATETAERISAALKANSRDSALRGFLDYSDSLRRAQGVDRVVLTVSEPHPTGSSAWDAALAALADYWLSKSKLPQPAWITAPRRTLQAPESPQLGPYDLEPDLAEVPSEFLRRNVLIERATLESV
nr:helix-turn-helix transcriptional regulator [Diaminobutyricibacter tongyongensis]